MIQICFRTGLLPYMVYSLLDNKVAALVMHLADLTLCTCNYISRNIHMVGHLIPLGMTTLLI